MFCARVVNVVTLSVTQSHESNHDGSPVLVVGGFAFRFKYCAAVMLIVLRECTSLHFEIFTCCMHCGSAGQCYTWRLARGMLDDHGCGSGSEISVALFYSV